jgi:hypothetical protein
MQLFFSSLTILLQSGRSGRSGFTVPYDSTQGVPGFVFLGFWVIIFLFGIRLAWEYRDKIFSKHANNVNPSTFKYIHTKMSVDEFVEKTNHPLKMELVRLRAIIRESDTRLTEQIKWNAPSFCHNGEDRITFNLSKKDSLLLIFHRGAKPKKVKFTKHILPRDTNDLEWPAFDRAIMRFATMTEVNEKKDKLQSIVKDWISITSRYAT